MKKIRIKWLAVSSFEIEYDGFTIVTDPYITDCVGTDLTADAIEGCDVICLTHTHWDHITDVPYLVEKFKPIVMTGDMSMPKVAEWLDYTFSRIYPMYPDTELDFDKVKIRALYGRHTNLGHSVKEITEKIMKREICEKYPDIIPLQTVGSLEYRNYLFTFSNGKKLLLWGNDPTIDQLNICKALNPDIAIIQRSLGDEAILAKARFAKEIGCKVLIPHHHDFRQVDAPEPIEKFEREFLALAPDCTFINPKHGEWIEL